MFLLFTLILLVCMCAVVHLWRSGDTFQESIPSFYHVGSRGLTLPQAWLQAPLSTEPSQRPVEVELVGLYVSLRVRYLFIWLSIYVLILFLFSVIVLV